MLQCTMEQQEQILTVWLTGEVDHHNAARVRPSIDARILSGAPKLVILDFSAVGFMDSSGVGLILGRQRLVATLGGSLAIHGVNGQTARLLRLAGIRSVNETGGITSESK